MKATEAKQNKAVLKNLKCNKVTQVLRLSLLNVRCLADAKCGMGVQDTNRSCIIDKWLLMRMENLTNFMQGDKSGSKSFFITLAQNRATIIYATCV